MIQVCIFVPFLAAETPKPTNVQKVPSNRESELQILSQISQVLDQRNRISEAQRRKQLVGKAVFTQHMLSGELQEVPQVQPLSN